MAEDIKRKISIFINDKEVVDSLGGIGREIGKLKRLRKEASNPEDRKKYNQQLQEAQKRYAEINNELRESKTTLQDFKSNFSNIWDGFLSGDAAAVKNGLLGIKAGFSGLITTAKAFIATPLGITLTALAAVIGAGKMWYDYNVALSKTLKLTEQLTGLQGKELSEYRAQVQGVANTFDQEYNEVLKAANSLAKQMKISQSEALTLIEQGFVRGANASGDFLDKVKEYPVQFKNAGYSAQEFIDVATQEATGGVYSDKLLDTLKEADLALKEMTNTQREALENAFGKKFTDELAKGIASGEVTTKEAIQRIIVESDKLGLNVQQQQQLLADVFKGAGEDAGGFSVIVEQLNEAFNEQNKQLTANEEATARLASANREYETALADLFDASKSGFPAMLTNIKAIGVEMFTNTIRGFKMMVTSLEQMESISKDTGSKKAVEDVVEDMKRFGSSKADAIKYGLIEADKNIKRISKEIEDQNLLGKFFGSEKQLKAKLAEYKAYKNELLLIEQDSSAKFNDIYEGYINPDDPKDTDNPKSNTNNEKEDKLTPEDKKIIESKKKLAEFLKEWEEDQALQKELNKVAEEERQEEEDILKLERKFEKMEEEAGLLAEKETELSEADAELKAQLEETKLQQIQEIRDRYEAERAAKRKKAELENLKNTEKLHKKLAKASMDLEYAKADALRFGIASLRNALGDKIGISKALFLLEKGLAVSDILNNSSKAIAQIASNTAIANSAAVAASPLTAGMPFVGINTALAAKQTLAAKITAGVQIASILGQTVQGFEDGLYPVTRTDGKKFNAKLGGPTRTQIISQPTLMQDYLVGERRRPEMIIDDRVFSKLPPWVIDTIFAVRDGRTVDGYEDGKYSDVSETTSSSIQTEITPSEFYSMLNNTLNKLNNLLDEGIKAKAIIGYSEVLDIKTQMEELESSKSNGKLQE